MSFLIRTESGATYEIEPGRVRRIEGGDGNTKRRDGEWIALHGLAPNPPVVGRGMTLTLSSLAPFGPDDYGTEDPDPHYTTRRTTPVVSIQEDA